MLRRPITQHSKFHSKFHSTFENFELSKHIQIHEHDSTTLYGLVRVGVGVRVRVNFEKGV